MYVYLLFTSGSLCSLIPLEATAYLKKQTCVIPELTWGAGVEWETKKKSHSINLFKYIQIQIVHIHYSTANITKSKMIKP